MSVVLSRHSFFPVRSPSSARPRFRLTLPLLRQSRDDPKHSSVSLTLVSPLSLETVTPGTWRSERLRYDGAMRPFDGAEYVHHETRGSDDQRPFRAVSFS